MTMVSGKKILTLVLIPILAITALSLINNGKNKDIISLRSGQNLIDGTQTVKINFQNKEIDTQDLKIYYADAKSRFKPIRGTWSKDAQGAIFKSEKFYPTEFVITSPANNLTFSIKGSNLAKNIDECINLKDPLDKELCANKLVALTALKNHNVKESLTIVQDFMEKDINGRTYCHAITHNLGEVATHIYENYQAASIDGNKICVEGYYHGIMEAFQIYWDDQEFQSMLSLLCEKYTVGLDQDSCTHGIGHMVMSRQNNDFQKSIKVCQSIPGSELEPGQIYRKQDSCITGVSMQWGINYSTGNDEVKKQMYPRKDSPIHICDSFEGDDLNYQACYADITNVYYYEKNPTELTIKACQALEGSKQIGCYQSLAMYMQLIADTTVKDIGKSCATAPLDKAMWRCFSETVTTYMGTLEPNANKILCAYAREIKRYNEEDCQFIMRQSTT